MNPKITKITNRQKSVTRSHIRSRGIFDQKLLFTPRQSPAQHNSNGHFSAPPMKRLSVAPALPSTALTTLGGNSQKCFPHAMSNPSGHGVREAEFRVWPLRDRTRRRKKAMLPTSPSPRDRHRQDEGNSDTPGSPLPSTVFPYPKRRGSSAVSRVGGVDSASYGLKLDRRARPRRRCEGCSSAILGRHNAATAESFSRHIPRTRRSRFELGQVLCCLLQVQGGPNSSKFGATSGRRQPGQRRLGWMRRLGWRLIGLGRRRKRRNRHLVRHRGKLCLGWRRLGRCR